MKKTAFILLFIFTVFSSFAQVIRTRDGLPVLPEKGDWSIGFDATRLIKLANLGFFSTSQMITGKYMIDSTTAWRGGFRLGVNSWTTRNRAINRAVTYSNTTHPAPLAMNDNLWIRNALSVGVSFGIEKRRGKTRLQGIYGIEGGIYVSTSTDKFSYATALSASPSNQIGVDTTDLMNSPILGSGNNINYNPPIVNVQGGARVVERNNGFGITIGARAFIGAEYFLLPKISIGGEFGWGMSYTSTGRTEIIYESIGSGSGGPDVRRTTVDGDASNVFSLDTDTGAGIGGPSASVRVNLYF